jgi:glutathione-regulated potassium-efflux system ancillary protein KefG
MAVAPVLILFAHPALEKSRVNRHLLTAVRDLEHVTVHDLYEAYPDFQIDVEREQALLTAHEVVVFHHPFYWYSTPPLLKQWQDLVLEHGWAYGSAGTALRGKTFLSVVTTGGREAAYQEGGYNRFTMRQLLAPIEQTARLCGMDFLPPFVVHGTHRITPDDVAAHARDYADVITALRDGTLDRGRAGALPRLNADLGTVLAAARTI